MNSDDSKESSLAWPKDRCVECQLSTETTPTNFELKQQLISRIRDNDIDYLKTTLSKFKQEERKQLVDTPRCLIDDLSTLLMHAVYHGRTEIIDYLIDDCGCDVSIKNIADWTALMFAAWKGHTKIVETLLNKGADIDAVNSYGSTALHIATDKGHEHVVRKLLDRGADPTFKDNACWTALEIAKYNSFQSIEELLKDKMPRDFMVNEDLLWSVRLDDVVSFKKILQENKLETREVLDSLFDGTISWLMCASHYGSTDIVKYLLELKCDVHLKSSAEWTALIFAANAGHKHVVNVLLRARSDIDATNRLGSTALHLAFDKGHVNIVKQLLGQQARTDIKDSAGLTAFQIAKTSDVCEEAKKMISKMITSNYMSSSFHPIAEMIDFAYEYKTSCLQIDTIDIKHKPCLEFVYDDIDLDNEDLSTMLLPKLRDSLRCLGNDVLMFTKNKSSLAVTYLSPAYLMSAEGETLVAPRVEYGLPGLSRSNSFDIDTLKSVLKNPMVKTEHALKNEMRKLCESPSSQRVMIKIYNLTKLKGEGLSFHFDLCDILCFETSPDNIQSLREFCRVLHLQHDVKIILRGVEVKSILDADYFHFSKTYKCNLGQVIENETSLDITFGFPKDNKKTKACGLIIYHKNRLVKIKKVTNAERLIGVVNIDYLTPTWLKHDFIKDEKYRNTMKLLRRKKKHFIKQRAKLGLG